MSRIAVIVALALMGSTAHAEPILPWYRGFYTRVGIRDSFGAQQPFHAWAAFAFGIGYRFNRERWGVDASALNFQYDPEEGLHTAGRILPYLALQRWVRIDAWIGAGLSFGWLKGTVDEALAKRRGQGFQSELALGIELPRNLHVRTFVQATLTAPIYNLYDPMYHSRDSRLYVYAFEAALGVRF